MREIEFYSQWANSVTESSRLGTPMSAQADRPLPREHDIQYKASRVHPELSPEQALALFMADELEKSDEIDAKQDKQINHIDHEVDHVEHDEVELQNQIARLMQLIKNTR